MGQFYLAPISFFPAAFQCNMWHALLPSYSCWLSNSLVWRQYLVACHEVCHASTQWPGQDGPSHYTAAHSQPTAAHSQPLNSHVWHKRVVGWQNTRYCLSVPSLTEQHCSCRGKG